MKKIIATLGPASFNKNIVQKMASSGVDIFRINLSHINTDQYEEIINDVSKWTNKPICPDTEGAQLRTGTIKDSVINVEEQSRIDFVSENNYENTKNQIPLNINHINKILQPGDILKIDFNSAIVHINNVRKDIASGRVLSGGLIGSNKGINNSRTIILPSFSEKDLIIIEISKRLKQKMIFLSFCSSKKDIIELRNIYGYPVKVIAKIESAAAIKKLDEICKHADGILIDRGDLSREVPIEKIPFAQSYIIKTAKKFSTPVYIATNLMESMIKNSKPTRAEVSDIVQSLECGVDGLVLAAETAIGEFPVECIRIMSRIINEHKVLLDKKNKKFIVKELLQSPTDKIIKPHGGTLIQQKTDKIAVDDILIVEVDERTASDAKQIAEGAFSPIESFMNLKEMKSILERNQLVNDIEWTLPIIFQINENEVKSLTHDGFIALKELNKKDVFGILKVDRIQKINNPKEILLKWYGTDDRKHPGVSMFLKRGNYIISGRPTLFNNYQSIENNIYDLTPLQSRELFNHNGWSKIVGFHTRNVPHRGHEYIQLKALERLNADAIYIAPVIGKKKKGDFKSSIILHCYETLIKNGVYGQFGTVLNGLNTYSRYSGPREAIFTAICHKNFGCSHFIVGRDHTGVGNFYEMNSSKDIFDCIDLKMEIIKFDEVAYDSKEKIYFENTNQITNKDIHILKGTEVRNRLSLNEAMPEYLIRAEISQLLLNYNQYNPEEVFE